MSSTIRFEPAERVSLSSGATILEAARAIDNLGLGFVFVSSEDSSSLGLITDGDLRRLVLSGADLDGNAFSSSNKTPFSISGSIGEVSDSVQAALNHYGVVPIKNTSGSITHIAYLEPNTISANVAIVIMAGGEGTRMRPLTESTPKPLLNIAGKPMIRWVQKRAIDSGIAECQVVARYMHEEFEKILNKLEQGFQSFKLVIEDVPLGTAGALRLVRTNADFLIVQNADVMCDINYQSLVQDLQDREFDALVVTKSDSWQNPFGVVIKEGEHFKGIEEKPVFKFEISAGIYVFRTKRLAQYFDLRQHLGDELDMPDLLVGLRKSGFTIGMHMHRGYWRDVGTPEALLEAEHEHVGR